MMFQQFLQDFGYLASFFGTFLEGETILVLVGFLAFRSYIQLDTVILTALPGSYAGDQLWYFLGRHYGRRLLARKPCWQKLGDKVLDRVRRHPDLWVLSFRSVYGLCTMMPVAIGLSDYPPARYLFFNDIGAIVWAAALGSTAYYFDSVLEGMLGNVKKYELMVPGGLTVPGSLLWLWRCFKTPRGNGVDGNADKSE